MKKSFQITEQEFNYLVSKSKNIHNDKYFIIVDGEELEDILNALKGLCQDYTEDSVNKMLVYRCCLNGSLNEFRQKYNLPIL